MIISRLSQLLAVIVAGLLVACKQPRNDAFAGIAIAQSHSEVERATLRLDLPQDPSVVIKPQAGFQTWQEALDAMGKVTIDIEVIDATGKSERFKIGENFSDNTRIEKFSRKDGTFDFGGGLRTEQPKQNATLHVRIKDPKNVLRFPVAVELRRRS